MMQHKILLFIYVIFLLVYLFEATWWCSKGYNPMECTSNGSAYIEYRCDHSTETYVEDKLHICSDEKPTCKCFTDHDNVGTKQSCECVSARKRPSFPATGIIRWNGSLEYANNYDGTRTTFLPGEAHKDSRGRFFLKETKVHWPHFPNSAPPTKTVKFIIILPNSKKGTFVKYTGDTRWKKCTMTEVKEEGKLISIWKDDHRKYYHLIEEKTKSMNHVTQVWYQEVPADYEEEEWKLIIDYDKKKEYAVPVTYDYEFVDHWGYEKKKIHLDYTYQPLKDNEESFKLKDYCTSIGKRIMPRKKTYGGMLFQGKSPGNANGNPN